MRNNLSLALAITLGLSVSGCSSWQAKQTPLEEYQAHFMSVTPTHASVEPVFVEAKQKALDEPTQQNIEAFNYVLGLKRLLGQELNSGSFGLKYKQVSREPSIDWGNDERGGAVLRQPAFIHTLAGSIHNERPAKYQDTVKVNTPPKHLLSTSRLTTSSANSAGVNSKPQGLSVYELSRWERYCNSGKGMDQKDWNFVMKEGLDNVPSILAFDCSPPTTLGRAR